MWQKRLLAFFLFLFYRLLQLTWRIEVRESAGLKKLIAEKKPFVVAHWHGEELGIVHLLKRYHVACMVSQSKDGEIMATVVRLMGSRAVRGSSSRGAVQAAKGILRLAKEGWRPSVAVDGPRGPRHVVKPGVVEIAKIIKAPICSISMAASKSHIFQKSWNKIELPLFFSRLVVEWGEPIPVDRDTPTEDLVPLVDASLNKGLRKAEAAIKE